MNLVELVPLPCNWRSKGQYSMEVEITENNYRDEYRYVKNLIKNSICLQNLETISRIENAYLYGRYTLRKEEYAAKFMFFEL